MSRRSHHGGRHHGRPHKAAERRPVTPSTLASAAPSEVAGSDQAEPFERETPERSIDPQPAESAPVEVDVMVGQPEPAELAFAPLAELRPEPIAELRLEPIADPAPPHAAPIGADAHTNGDAHDEHHPGTNGDGQAGTCTAPQLRRFIKSRAYVPMHELRRRFAINGSEDDVTQVDVHMRRIYIGLPEREGRLLGELLRGGDVGFELSLDPITPIVVGVYPMRPVPRP